MREDSLICRYDMSHAVVLPDLGWKGNRYPGVGANIAGIVSGATAGGFAAEFNGNNSNYNLGDILELNAVSSFTIVYWMSQDVLDANDYIFWKVLDATHQLLIYTSPDRNFYFRMVYPSGSYNARFDYSTVENVGQWHHIAHVYDSSEVVNADRMKTYIDGNRMVLVVTANVPVLSPDMAGADLRIGTTSNSFDGKLDDFRIYSDPLSNLQVTDLMVASRQGRTGG